MLPDERLQAILATKADGVPGESWAIVDGALVIYDFITPPEWLVPVLAARDDDGNTDQLSLTAAMDAQAAKRTADMAQLQRQAGVA